LDNQKLYIIAGCNGAGKTTASFSILPEILECIEFVNADEIARGLSPFNPEAQSIKAGKLMVNRIAELLSESKTFSIETTLSSLTLRRTIENARKKNYNIMLLFFWLDSVALAIERVKIRVSEGGHNIPEDVIRRRYISGLINLFDVFLPIVDNAFIFDNSSFGYKLIAEKELEGNIIKVDEQSFNIIWNKYEEFKFSRRTEN